MDTHQLKKDAKDIEPHVNIIKQLTETNNSLVQRNMALKNEINLINQTDRERGHEAMQYIMHWRSEIDARSDKSPPLCHRTSDYNFKKKDIKLPKIIWNQGSDDDGDNDEIDNESQRLSSTEDF